MVSWLHGRSLRIQFAGAIYHAMARGNARQRINVVDAICKRLTDLHCSPHLERVDVCTCLVRRKPSKKTKIKDRAGHGGVCSTAKLVE